MLALGESARRAVDALKEAGPEVRTLALRRAAEALRRRADPILAASRDDLEAAKASPPALRDRLALDPSRIADLAASLEAIAALEDPVGRELERWRRPNGLDIARVAEPIGVIGMIFEARPGVTAEAAAICIRSANAVLLRPAADCFRTAQAINAAFCEGLVEAGLPKGAAQVAPTPDREAVALMLEGLGGALDLLVPRGGRALIERVEREAKVPVLGHREGLNHTFVHAAADPKMAVDVVVNAKMRRVSVCGATETLLIDRAALNLLKPIAAALAAAGCEIRADAEAREAAAGLGAATDEDWGTEHLAPVIGVRTVAGLEGALEHIKTYGSGHTEAVITEDGAVAEAFACGVDAAIVLINASTQFADGGEFGFGGEIGIATGRLHARGPVGAAQLTTYKYVVRGSGQTRP